MESQTQQEAVERFRQARVHLTAAAAEYAAAARQLGLAIPNCLKPISLSAAAQLLQVAPVTVAKWITDKRLRSHTLPGAKRKTQRIALHHLLDFMDQHGIPLELLRSRLREPG